MEKYVENAELIPEAEWNLYIEGLKSRVGKASEKELENSLTEAIKSRIPNRKFGIFFSGGVDSTFISFICKKLNADFICYSVGVKGSKDLEWAQRIAKELNLNFRFKELTLDELEDVVKKVVKILKTTDVVKVGVGAVVLAAAELAKEDGITDFFGGLGSEEIFAGYERHAKAADANEECWIGLKSMWQRDLTRDVALGKALKISVMTPFLDENVILQAMAFNSDRKINNEHKKIILREIAESSGLNKEFAWRKKIAAQYGSKIDNAMEKLAKRKGFKLKKDYLNSLLRFKH